MSSTKEIGVNAVTSGGRERVEQCAQLMASVFGDDPVFNWLLHNTPREKKDDQLLKLMQGMLQAAAIGGGSIYEVNDWGASAAILPPGRKPDSLLPVLRAGLIPALLALGVPACKRLAFEYTNATGKVKSRHMTKVERTGFWYVLILGTALDRRRQGLAGRLTLAVQARARAEGRPVWLEATTVTSRKLYAKYGFEVVEDIVLGKGEVDSTGQTKEKGEGITIWGMIWRPNKNDSHAEQ